MKKWGLVVSVYYLVVVLAMFWPFFLSGLYMMYDNGQFTWQNYASRTRELYGEWRFAFPVAVVFVGQFLLLFISVDISNRRLKPRVRLLLPAILTGLFTAVLAFGACTSLLVTITGDKFFDYLDNHRPLLYSYLLVWPVLWIVWGAVFYVYTRNKQNPISLCVSWLLKGSILEFLIAVPCHIIVRRRDDCCAPAATSLGLCTGIAIMLLSFGPSVLLLYRNRMAAYAQHTAQGRPH